MFGEHILLSLNQLVSYRQLQSQLLNDEVFALQNALVDNAVLF